MLSQLIRNSCILSFMLLFMQTSAVAQLPGDTTKEIALYNINDSIPDGAITIDNFKFGDNGFTTDCQYQRVIEKAKEKAIKAGGNAIKLTEVKQPDMWSSCYRIKGKILQVSNTDHDAKLLKSGPVLEDEDIPVDSSANYSTLYLYRVGDFVGSAIGYNVYLDDSVICRITNNSKFEIKIYKPGTHKVWAKTEAKAIVPLEIKPGRSYYIKCGIQTGFWVGQPQMNLVYPTHGKEEYESMAGKKKKRRQTNP